MPSPRFVDISQLPNMATARLNATPDFRIMGKEVRFFDLSSFMVSWIEGNIYAVNSPPVSDDGLTKHSHVLPVEQMVRTVNARPATR